MTALEQVLADDSFKVKTPSTIEARRCAEKLLQWCLNSENVDLLNEFTKKLTESLQNVIRAASTKSFNTNYEKIWRGFFLLPSKPEFIKQWTTFLKAAGKPVKPVLFQHLTDVMFRKYLSDHIQVIYLQQQSGSKDIELRESEKGVLRYVAGYICRHLQQKLERGSHQFKEEMILCLMELVKDQDTEQHGIDEDWTDLVDRGGLWHIKETTYQLFSAIEDAVRNILKLLVHPSAPSKLEVMQKVTSDDDVLFYWLIVSADFEIDDREVHTILLEKIVELYVTVRGFSLASGWLEQYKQCTKQSTQRTKSLRRELHDGTV